MANELKYEDSPYLKQHANNPVSWFAWKDATFLKAKEENKLIFLSIGYSTCHWCHVMEEESFEDKEVAKILNDDFISIKVDREEMPDVDKYYQDIHYILQQKPGGWPLTIILLPNKKVIYSATYLPKEDRGSFKGLKGVLNFFIQAFKNQTKELYNSSNSIENAYLHYQNSTSKSVKLHFSIIDDYIAKVENSYEPTYKGIGNGHKFPHANTFEALLDIYSITKDKKALSLSQDALSAMAKGGINDQIEGGFYRYSVDIKWQIPHFEKMLYTNAELISAYSKAYSINKNPLYKNTVEKTIEAMNERFLYNDVYFSASDADSQGEEGKYFVFEYEKTKNYLEQYLTKENTRDILEYLNISDFGNFEAHTTNPYITEDIEPNNLQTAKNLLKKLRSDTKYPFIDKKILTSWNALFINALFQAGELVDEKYTQMAFTTLDKLLQTNYKNKQLYHQYLFGSSLKIEALLEDYAFLSQALLKAYELSENKKYLNLAKEFINSAKKHFYRNNNWYLGYFNALAPLEDNAYKSPVSSIMDSMLSLALFTNEVSLISQLKQMIKPYSSSLEKYPNAYSSAILVWLKMQKNQILVKVPKNQKKAVKKKLKRLNYPFIHIISHENKKYQACQVQLCFANENTIEELVKKIENMIKQ